MKNIKLEIGNFERGIASMAEIMLVMGIFTLLLGIGAASFSRIQQSSSINGVVDNFLASMKEQQMKAMTGYTGGGIAADHYGIFFEGDKYTLFKGADPALDPNKFEIKMPPTIVASTDSRAFTVDHVVIFEVGSGKYIGCCTVNTMTFLDTSANIEKTITLNGLGVVTSIATN